MPLEECAIPSLIFLDGKKHEDGMPSSDDSIPSALTTSPSMGDDDQESSKVGKKVKALAKSWEAKIFESMFGTSKFLLHSPSTTMRMTSSVKTMLKKYKRHSSTKKKGSTEGVSTPCRSNKSSSCSSAEYFSSEEVDYSTNFETPDGSLDYVKHSNIGDSPITGKFSPMVMNKKDVEEVVEELCIKSFVSLLKDMELAPSSSNNNVSFFVQETICKHAAYAFTVFSVALTWSSFCFAVFYFGCLFWNAFVNFNSAI